MQLRHFLDWLSGPSYQWDWHQLGRDQKVTAVDGTVLSGVVMRRKIRGQFQYRLPTEEEHREEAEAQAFRF